MVTTADVVPLTVPVGTIGSLINYLDPLGAWSDGRRVVHANGFRGLELLASIILSLKAHGVLLHSVMTFNGMAKDLACIDGCGS